MTNQQILRKAIEKVEKNGWESPSSIMIDASTMYEWEIRGIIFSHDFAKAFWGEGQKVVIKDKIMVDEIVWRYDEELHRLPRWQYHLQRMVLEKEPLKYLEKFL